jgi:hypothetical protein
MSTRDGRWEIREEGGELGQAETARWAGAGRRWRRRVGEAVGSRVETERRAAASGGGGDEARVPPRPLRVAYIPAGRRANSGPATASRPTASWLLDGLLAWAEFSRVKWATPFWCRVRANTACRDLGPDTAHHRVVPTLTIRPSC